MFTAPYLKSRRRAVGHTRAGRREECKARFGLCSNGRSHRLGRLRQFTYRYRLRTFPGPQTLG